MKPSFKFREAELAHVAAGGHPKTTFRAHLRTRWAHLAYGLATNRTYTRLLTGLGSPFDLILTGRGIPLRVSS